MRLLVVCYFFEVVFTVSASARVYGGGFIRDPLVVIVISGSVSFFGNFVGSLSYRFYVGTEKWDCFITF